MNETNVVKKAAFSPKVCTYWLLSGAIIFAITVVGIPLLFLWFPIGHALTKRYLDRMECTLTRNALKVKKGIFVRVEKTIPLEKITDMGMVQGPILRHFDLHTLTIETAGQSGQGSLVSLTGIVDAPSFREAVLTQRDLLAASASHPTPESGRQDPVDSISLLSEIRDSLLRIEGKLDRTDGS